MPKDISLHHHQGNVNGDSTHYQLDQDDPGPVEQFPIHPSPPEFLPWHRLRKGVEYHFPALREVDN